MRLWTLSAALVASISAAPLLADTSDFLVKAMKGDNSETKLGAFAARHGGSAKVRDFGAMLERDHTKGKAQAVAIAARHHVPATDAIADEARTELGILEHLHGAAFDSEFGRYMVKDHEQDIADFEKEARSSDPADVRALAKQTLPVLRKHLTTARSIK